MPGLSCKLHSLPDLIMLPERAELVFDWHGMLVSVTLQAWHWTYTVEGTVQQRAKLSTAYACTCVQSCNMAA